MHVDAGLGDFFVGQFGVVAKHHIFGVRTSCFHTNGFEHAPHTLGADQPCFRDAVLLQPGEQVVRGKEHVFLGCFKPKSVEFREVLCYGFGRIIGEEVTLNPLAFTSVEKSLGPLNEFTAQVNGPVKVEKNSVNARKGSVHVATLEHQGLEHEPWGVEVFLRFFTGDHLRHHLLNGWFFGRLSNKPVEQPSPTAHFLHAERVG